MFVGTAVQYDDDWNEMDYLVVTRETAFEINLLEKFDIELLIGQVRKSNNYPGN